MVQKKFRGNAVFIGEYTFGKESTVPRALIVNLTTPPNGRILDKYQRHQPLLVSTFYYYFIEWYVNNYNAICDELDKRLTKFREGNTSIHLRLRDTQFYLQTSYMLLLRFCEDSGFISAEDAQDEYISFGTQLVDLIREQQTRIRPDEEKSKEVDYLKLIRNLYKSNSFRLAESMERFDLNKHDGLIYYECLCLRRENLEKRIQKIFHGAKINDIINTLLTQNAFKLVNKKYTVQISGLSGLRFCAIWLEMLD